MSHIDLNEEIAVPPAGSDGGGEQLRSRGATLTSRVLAPEVVKANLEVARRNCSCEGWLRKAGKTGRGKWHKKFFVINGDYLMYFPSDKPSESGKIRWCSLSGSTPKMMVTKFAHHMDGFKLMIKAFPFFLDTADLDADGNPIRLVMCASSKSERTKWFDQLQSISARAAVGGVRNSPELEAMIAPLRAARLEEQRGSGPGSSNDLGADYNPLMVGGAGALSIPLDSSRASGRRSRDASPTTSPRASHRGSARGSSGDTDAHAAATSAQAGSVRVGGIGNTSTSTSSTGSGGGGAGFGTKISNLFGKRDELDDSSPRASSSSGRRVNNAMLVRGSNDPRASGASSPGLDASPRDSTQRVSPGSTPRDSDAAGGGAPSPPGSVERFDPNNPYGDAATGKGGSWAAKGSGSGSGSRRAQPEVSVPEVNVLRATQDDHTF